MEGRPTAWARALAWTRAYGRWVLLVLGVVVLGGLVVQVGPTKLWATMLLAGPWLPVILILDILWVAVEGTALLRFYGPVSREIPLRDWLRSMMAHYITMIALPVGRTGAEIARATMLRRSVGAQRATAGAAQIQAAVLAANGLISIPCLGASLFTLGLNNPLTLLLAGNAVVTLGLGVGLYLFMRRVSVGGWLGRRFARMAQFRPQVDEVLRESPGVPWSALGLCVAGRAIQTVEYGVMLLAVGGSLTWVTALISQGIHLVGASLGDMVPGQVGITEGAYRVFADALGLGATPEKALAIALVARTSTVAVAALCFLGLQVLPAQPQLVDPAGASVASDPSGMPSTAGAAWGGKSERQGVD